MTKPDQASFEDPTAKPPLFDLMDEFSAHLKLSAGASPSAANTAETYANALGIFRRFIQRAYSRKKGVRAPYPADLLESDVLLAYYDWLTKTPPKRTSAEETPATQYAHSTIQHYLAAARRFLRWAVAQDYIKTFDLGKTEVKLKGGRGTSGKAYPHRKIDPNLAKILLYYDELSMPDLPDEDDPDVTNLARYHARRRQIALLRNRAIVYVLFDTGLRVSELVGLRRDQVDRALKQTPLPDDLGLEVVGKGGRQRTVWITHDALSRIKAYLDTRDDPSNILFIGGKKDSPITRQMVWKIVTDGAKEANVGDFTGPHAFRHWLARQLFNDEEDPVPMEDVQALLGHASPTTTRTIYAPHSANSRLHKAIKRSRKRPEDTIEE